MVKHHNNLRHYLKSPCRASLMHSDGVEELDLIKGGWISQGVGGGKAAASLFGHPFQRLTLWVLRCLSVLRDFENAITLASIQVFFLDY